MTAFPAPPGREDLSAFAMHVRGAFAKLERADRTRLLALERTASGVARRMVISSSEQMRALRVLSNAVAGEDSLPVPDGWGTFPDQRKQPDWAAFIRAARDDH